MTTYSSSEVTRVSLTSSILGKEIELAFSVNESFLFFPESGKSRTGVCCPWKSTLSFLLRPFLSSDRVRRVSPLLLVNLRDTWRDGTDSVLRRDIFPSPPEHVTDVTGVSDEEHSINR